MAVNCLSMDARRVWARPAQAQMIFNLRPLEWNSRARFSLWFLTCRTSTQSLLQQLKVVRQSRRRSCWAASSRIIWRWCEMIAKALRARKTLSNKIDLEERKKHRIFLLRHAQLPKIRRNVGRSHKTNSSQYDEGSFWFGQQEETSEIYHFISKTNRQRHVSAHYLACSRPQSRRTVGGSEKAGNQTQNPWAFNQCSTTTSINKDFPRGAGC